MPYDFWSVCPDCKEPRSVTSDRSYLIVALEESKEISVASIICGHEWKLPGNERKNLQKLLNE